MKRPLRPEEKRLWSLVAGTVVPAREALPGEARTPVSKATAKALKKARLNQRAPLAPPVAETPPPAPEDPAWAALAASLTPRKPVKTAAKPVPRRTASASAPLLLAAEDLKALAAEARSVPQGPPDPIEPGRKRRLTRERDPLEARIDLHNLNQDQARPALEGFLRRCADEGMRAVLVITGKGRVGQGVLRRYVPEWLADPALRDIVAGVSTADRRHGGEGALYVALKKRP